MQPQKILIAVALVVGIVGTFGAPAHAQASYPSAGEFFAFLGEEDNYREFRDLVSYLRENGVADVVPPEQLVRQGTDYKQAGEPPFAMPPRDFWPNIIPTLKLIKEEIIPLVGELQVVSAYRSYRYNARAGGTEASAHLMFSAVDVVPKRKITRKQLHGILLKTWSAIGVETEWGLGLYSRLRFHVDTKSYRRW